MNVEELRYVQRRFVQKDALRVAIATIVNGTFQIRQSAIWGDVMTACAADSKQFGAYDQNLMAEWHARYGGRGVMIYWYDETHSTCIYSQLRHCSSSEVAALWPPGAVIPRRSRPTPDHKAAGHNAAEASFTNS